MPFTTLLSAQICHQELSLVVRGGAVQIMLTLVDVNTVPLQLERGMAVLRRFMDISFNRS